MPNLTGQEQAFCPFYHEDGSACIMCEGLTEFATHTLCFEDPGEKQDWLDFVCSQPEYARLCPYAAALLEIYQLRSVGRFCTGVHQRLVKARAIKNRTGW